MDASGRRKTTMSMLGLKSSRLSLMDASGRRKTTMSRLGLKSSRLSLLVVSGLLICCAYIAGQTTKRCFLACSSNQVSSRRGTSWFNVSSPQTTLATEETEDHEKTTIPSFENGGVIFFLHVPKSGGVTVRTALAAGFNRCGRGKYILADRRRKFDAAKHEINHYVKHGTRNKEIVVLELHAADSPTFTEVAGKLHQWRTLAAENGTPFFAFTLLREPLSFAISFFNFYYGMDHGDRRYQYFEVAEEKDFTRTAVFNPQCGFMVKSDVVFLKKEEKKLRYSECDRAYKAVLDHMDWAGTTENLSNETLPLLQWIVGTNMNADYLLPKKIKPQNKSVKKIRLSDLSAAAIDHIRKLTEWDLEMYRKVAKDFRFDRMAVDDGITL